MACRRAGATPTFGLMADSWTPGGAHGHLGFIGWSTNHNRARRAGQAGIGGRRRSPARHGAPFRVTRAHGYTGAMTPPADVTVPDLTHTVAGPFCTHILAHP